MDIRESEILKTEDKIHALRNRRPISPSSRIALSITKVDDRIPCLCVSGGGSYLSISTSIFLDMQIR